MHCFLAGGTLFAFHPYTLEFGAENKDFPNPER
jgi:hypothetical protein